MSEWISVKDRLPGQGELDDGDGYALVYETFKYSPIGRVTICGYTKDGWDGRDSFGSVRTENITHWMPLPDPPADEA